MKINPRIHRPAFTLIELMAVIVIIVILAGMVVGGLGYVNEKQARSKAQVQIALISKALEEYKLDNGQYPPTTNRTGSWTTAAGTGTSAILFDFLYFDSDRDSQGPPGDADQKIYLPDLDPLTSKQGWTTGTVSRVTKITDPWGNEYCYRTAMPATGTTANTGTQNPDFDLWSMGKNGKSNPASTNQTDKTNNADDVTN